MHGFEDADTGQEHVALVFGDVADEDVVLCRVHSECLTGDCLFSMRCDCGSQLEFAITPHAEQAVIFGGDHPKDILLGMSFLQHVDISENAGLMVLTSKL